MSLAAHSRRWWDDLDFFAPDVRRDYGKLFLQLERAFSSLAARPQRGEPAGWAGLSRRGNWDRLVHSEWAVAEACPEEFLRRAGEGELSFWQLAQQADAHNELLWCWLDVGPDQLGACRLVQLALLFYLQHLGLRNSGKLCWGTIQSPQRGYDALTAQEVQIYLRSRSLDPGRRPPDAPAGLQSWCIGSPAWLTQVPATYQKVALTQSGPETVELVYGARRLQLQLPPAARAARLMRDPFSQERDPAVASVSAGKLFFSQCGRKLLLVDESMVQVVPLPSSVSEPPGKVRRFPLKRPGRVVGLSWERHALHVCQQHQGEWTFSLLNPPSVQREGLVTVPAQPYSSVGCCWLGGAGYYLWVDECLWEAGSRGLEQKFLTCGGTAWGSRAVLADRTQAALATADGAVIYPLDQQKFVQVFLCSGRSLGLSGLGLIVALQRGGNKYRIIHRDRQADREVVRDLSSLGEVLGVTYCHSYHQPALVVRYPKHFQLLGADFSELLEVGAPIAQACLHFEGLLAYTTDSGRTYCYDTTTRTSLWASSR